MKTNYTIIEEEHLIDTKKKLTWCGYGEWVEELDSIVFEYNGYQASVKRQFIREPFSLVESYFGGYLCGYVRIHEEHPYYMKKLRDIPISCHGGITFCNLRDEDFWIGFDCSHFGDLVPTWQHKRGDVKESLKNIIMSEAFKKIITHPVYRNMQYCIDNCIKIIDQLSTATANHMVLEDDH